MFRNTLNALNPRKSKQSCNENPQEAQDPLTGIHSRLAFDAMHAQYEEEDNLHSILMCNIDLLSLYNNRFGQHEGDEVVQLVVSAIKLVVQDPSNLYRYSDNKIAIMLPTLDKYEAHQIGMRILKTVNALTLPHPDSELKVITLSIGCATSSEIQNNDIPLVDLASQRLDVAKDSGRNCLIYT